MVFLSTLSLRRATWYPQPGRHLGSDFYPRSPCGERPALSGGTLSDVDFYPRSPCGERRLAHETYVVMEAFLSTLSLRRATKYVYVWYTILVNFYPRSPCGERLPEEDMILEEQIISIHALLAESDKTYYWIHKPSLYISIHALLAESDFGPILAGFIGGLFLSTLSLRRATRAYQRHFPPNENFYPRSPCGERPEAEDGYKDTVTISIHALLAESDRIFLADLHALHDFYPRSPCGERHVTIITICIAPKFLSTLSLRRATFFSVTRYRPTPISIHALLAESDIHYDNYNLHCVISIHALLAESDYTLR